MDGNLPVLRNGDADGRPVLNTRGKLRSRSRYITNSTHFRLFFFDSDA